MSVNEELLERGKDILQQAPERCRNCKEALDGACEVAKLAIDHLLDSELVARKFEVVLEARCNGPKQETTLATSPAPTETTECGYKKQQAQTVPEDMVVEVIWQLD